MSDVVWIKCPHHGQRTATYAQRPNVWRCPVPRCTAFVTDERVAANPHAVHLAAGEVAE